MRLFLVAMLHIVRKLESHDAAHSMLTLRFFVALVQTLPNLGIMTESSDPPQRVDDLRRDVQTIDEGRAPSTS
jgi:hypothetical protein